MFIIAIDTIGKTWKQPRCPSTDEWLKMWYTYKMKYYSAINGTDMSGVLKWMNLESVIQSEVSQKEKNKYHILTHTYGIQKKCTDEPSREWTSGLGEGEGGMN